MSSRDEDNAAGSTSADSEITHNEEPDVWIPLKERKERLKERALARLKRSRPTVEALSRKKKAKDSSTERAKKSLLEVVAEQKLLPAESRTKTKIEEIAEAERELIQSVNEIKPLKSVSELAHGISYTKPLETSWAPPRFIQNLSTKTCDNIREHLKIFVDGENCPPPCLRFKDMKFPKCILDNLKAKGIKQPTPIQIQGLPAVLSGRDIIGVAFTGSGKTLVFVLPLLMFALETQLIAPLRSGEGPIGLIVCPSRELARQTYEIVNSFIDVLCSDGQPELSSLLC